MKKKTYCIVVKKYAFGFSYIIDIVTEFYVARWHEVSYVLFYNMMSRKPNLR